MNFNLSKQRIYASLLILGACILLFRTIVMVSQGYLAILIFWVSALLIAEMLVDAACLATSIRWWIADDKKYDSIPLRFGAAVAILHAIRVLVFILGRIGPWIDFDVRPVHRALHHTRWSPWQLYFAGILSVLGVIGVIVIWTCRRRAKNRRKNGSKMPQVSG
jgi:hypothetical protein